MLIDPLDRLVSILDELQVGGASLARLLGVAAGARRPRGRPARSPTGEQIEAEDVRFAYVDGPRRAARRRPRRRGRASGSPWSGRPAPASRRSAGCWPGIHPPRTGSVTVGGVGAHRAAAGPTCAATSRWSPRSTTCSSARCATTWPWRRRPSATDDELRDALRVGRRPRLGRWRCPTGWTPWSAPAAARSPPAQAQQIALARLVLADPHTLVLDEATSLIDPRAARHLERSLAGVLDGRTVDRDRAPAVHRARRRPGRRGRGRPDQRARLPRRAGRGGRVLRRPVGVVASVGGWRAAGIPKVSRFSGASRGCTPLEAQVLLGRSEEIGKWDVRLRPRCPTSS